MDKTVLEKTVRYSDAILKSVLSSMEPSRTLVVDLTTEKCTYHDIPQAYLEKYAGGQGLAARIWADFVGSSIDQKEILEEDNPIVIVPSITVNSQDSYGQLSCVAFRSPVTGNIAFNNFQSSMNFGSFSAVVILGKLKTLGTISFTGGGFDFSYPEKLDELTNSQIAENYHDAIINGKAGDKGILFSTCIYHGRPTGRYGIGAVFGRKNLKVVEVSCTQEADYAAESKCWIDYANKRGWAPIRNFTLRCDPRLFHLTDDEVKRKLGSESVPASFAERLMLGANAGTFDSLKVQERYYLCLEYGLDPVSVGNLMGWAMTHSMSKFDFKDNRQALGLISHIYRGICEGCSIKNGAAALEGGLTINNLECGPYDYRGAFAQALSDALGNNFPHYFDLAYGIKKNVAVWVDFVEDLVLGLRCMGMDDKLIYPLIIKKQKYRCLLATHFGFSPKSILSLRKIVSRTAGAAGTELKTDMLLQIGSNCKTLVRSINKLLKQNQNLIPDYFCIEPSSNFNENSVVPLRTLLKEYNLLLTSKAKKKGK